MTNNLPALPVRSRIESICEIITLPWFDEKTGEVSPNASSIMSQESDLRAHAISQYFDGRFVASFRGHYFWVFCQNWDEVEEVKAKARAYGYKRLSTIVPKMADPENPTNTVVDSKGNYAVRVETLSKLVISKEDQHFINMFEDVLKPFRESITFTYCYMREAKFSVCRTDEAESLVKALNDFIESMTRAVSKVGMSAPDLVTGIEKDSLSLDEWKVTLKHIAKH